MTHQPARAGFTIMEMIIAFTIMGLMLFLIDKIFFESTRGIEQGMGLSNITMSSNIVSDQLHRDFEQMQPPSSNAAGSNYGGVIMIFNKRITAPRLLEDAGNTTSSIRSDQIAFIYNNSSGSLRPVTPASQSSFEPNAGTFPYVRIWYGHVVRTTPDGTSASDLGASGPNYIAKDWILGRQALFLSESATGVRTDSGGGGNDARVTTPTLGYSAGNGFPAALGSPIPMYKGLVDVADEEFGPAGSISSSLLKDLNTGDYASEAYTYMYGANRLWVNPSPAYNASAANYQYSMASWQLAQMHGYFVEHVSDFEVAFAGDYTDTAGTAGADGLIDTDVSGNMKWYDVDNPPPVTEFDGTAPKPIYDTAVVYGSANPPANADAAFIFRNDDTSRWPHLIRIRYRMHDKLGKFNSYVPGTGSVPGMWFETIVRVKRS